MSNRGGSRDVYQQAVDGNGRHINNPVRLTTGLGPYRIPLSNNGEQLAYDAVRNYSNILAVDIGANVKRVSEGTAITRENQHIEAVLVSHDKKWLAYDSDRAGNFDIYKVPVAGGDPVQLTSSTANDFAPSWSGDDLSIFFHSPRSGNRDLFMMNADGRNEVKVIGGPEEDYSPTVSPDGKHLVFGREENSGFVYEMADRLQDGRWSAPRTVAKGKPAVTQSQWSPDARSVALLAADGIEVARADGTDVRLLIAKPVAGASMQGFAFNPDWSKVYLFLLDSNRSAYIAEQTLGDRRLRRVLEEEPNGHFGRWEFDTDGKRLFYTRASWEADVGVIELKPSR